ncbi:MAG: tetratricopeptide repeat protein [Methanothrix sp.]
MNIRKMRAWTGLILVLATLFVLCLTTAAQEKTASYWANQGDELLGKGSVNEALEAYEKSLQMDPENESILLGLATMHHIRQVQSATKALGIIEKRLEKNPQDMNAWSNRGVALTNLGRDDDASKSREKVLELLNLSLEKDSTNSTSWMAKAEILAGMDRLEEAVQACDKVIEINSSLVGYAAETKGYLLEGLGRNEDALQAYDMAIELNPEKGGLWYSKGGVLKTLGRDSEADAAFAKAKDLGYQF